MAHAIKWESEFKCHLGEYGIDFHILCFRMCDRKTCSGLLGLNLYARKLN